MTGGILSGPAGHRSGGFRRLPSGEEAPLRAPGPRRAASPSGVHGSGRSAGARGARAGGGAAARGRGGASRQLRSCLPGGAARSRALSPLPLEAGSAARRSAPGPVRAHPRLEPARRPRAPGSRPGRHLPEREATSSSSRTLRPVACTAGPGAAHLPRRVGSAGRGGRARTGTGTGTRRGPTPGPRPGGTPARPGVGGAAARAEAGGGPSRAPPLPRRAPRPPRALTRLGPAPPVRPASDRALGLGPRRGLVYPFGCDTLVSGRFCPQTTADSGAAASFFPLGPSV